jgi:hypothetical protein
MSTADDDRELKGALSPAELANEVFDVRLVSGAVPPENVAVDHDQAQASISR